MNTETAEKIETVLRDRRKKASNRFGIQIREIDRKHDYPPAFVTPFMVREAARAAEDNLSKSIAQAGTAVSSLSETAEAHDLLKVAMIEHIANLQGMIERWNGVPLNPDNLTLATDCFAVVRQNLILYLEAIRFKFRNAGGRPQESKWEQVKDFLRSRYSEGFQKQPATQTALAEAMEAWFVKKGGKVPKRTQLMVHAGKLAKELQKP